MPLFGRRKNGNAEYNAKSGNELKDLITQSIDKYGASEELIDVYIALHEVNELHHLQASEKGRRIMLAKQDNLIKACDKYLDTRKNALTSKGKDRLDLVFAVRNMAASEDYRSVDISKYRGKNRNEIPTWGDLRDELRVIHKDITADTQVTNETANSSSRTVFEEGYFSESFTQHESIDDVFDDLYNGLSKDQKAILNPIKETIRENLVINRASYGRQCKYDDMKSYKRDEGTFLDTIADSKDFQKISPEKQELAVNATKDFMKELVSRNPKQVNKAAKLMENDNIPNRHVATSRIADMLGQPDLVAKSRKMIVTENGHTREGVVMAKANGLDLAKANDQQVEAFSKASLTDPRLQKQMNVLNIMDMVCGQVDRHGTNVFYQMEKDSDGKDKIVGLVGIDNDMSFGLGRVAKDKEDFFNNPRTTLDNDKTGNLDSIKAIDADLLDNLKQIQPDTLQYMLSDLVSKEAIDAVQMRVNDILEHVEKNKIPVIKEWNENTMDYMKDNRLYQLINGTQKFRAKELDAKKAKEEMAKTAAQKEKPQKEEATKEATAKEATQKEATQKETTKEAAEKQPETKAKGKEPCGLDDLENEEVKENPAKAARRERKEIIGKHRAVAKEKQAAEKKTQELKQPEKKGNGMGM